MIVLFVIKLIKDLVKERTESELLRQREHFLYTDALTNVYNRNYFNRIVIDTINLRQYPQSVIAADMNNLKVVNDKYGHSVGDMLLKLFADVLKEFSPKDSFIIRMGGDEFIIILEDTNDYQAEQLISKIKKEIEERNIPICENEELRASAAFGYSTRYNAEENFDELIKNRIRPLTLDNISQ